MGTRRMTLVLFNTYLLILTWVIVFKLGDLTVFGYRSLNLIPLAGTAVYDGQLDYGEILLNILFFIPFGIYMEMLARHAEWLTSLLLILAVSLSFEAIQYGFMIGMADITDVLANGLGGAIGINLMYYLTSIWKEEAYSRVNALAGLVTVGVLAYLFASL